MKEYYWMDQKKAIIFIYNMRAKILLLLWTPNNKAKKSAYIYIYKTFCAFVNLGIVKGSNSLTNGG